MRRYLRYFVLLSMVLSALGCSRESTEAPRDERVSTADFDRSAFLRRHPATARVESENAVAYRFQDRYGESRDISVEIEPRSGPIGALTVNWSGDSEAGWSSVKKQFLADLLESTFSDVDYGEVSAYALRRQEAHARTATETPIGTTGVTVQVTFAGHDLALRLERHAGNRLQLRSVP